MKDWAEVWAYMDGYEAAKAECKLEIKKLKNEITNMKLKDATEAYYQMKGKENG